MDTISYAETTEDRMFGIPDDRNPRFVRYAAAMDNYEPVPRRTECERLVEYDEPGESSGQPRYMRAVPPAGHGTAIPPGSIFIIDDGKTARPYYGGGLNPGTPSPLYPGGRVPTEMLCPFPVNPDGKTRPDGKGLIDFTNWLLGPRKAYLLKIARLGPGER
jgi:hypothetical protein